MKLGFFLVRKFNLLFINEHTDKSLQNKLNQPTKKQIESKNKATQMFIFIINYVVRHLNTLVTVT